MLAKRVCEIEESGTVKLANLVDEMKRKGIKIISFAVGEPDFTTPRHIIDAAIESLNSGFTHYTPSMGIYELREAIAERCNNYNKIPCKPKEVLVTPTKLAVYLAVMACINEGDEVIIPDPSWVTYEACVKLAGGKPVFVETREEDNYALTQESLQSSITPRTKMIIINTPSNPTGAVYTLDELKVIADIAKDHNLLVVSDEIYEELVYEGRNYSIASLDGMFERTITVNGFSKTFAMTGWRIGWAVGPQPIIEAMNKIQQHTLTCVCSFAQKAGIAALKGDRKPVDEMIKEFKERREIVCKGLNEIPGFKCKKPAGAFYVFPSYTFNKTSLELSEFLLKEARVAVTPGCAFGRCGEKHIRISYATSKECIMEGLKRISEAVSKLS
ncbi:MAG: pyridoxal phosphate-dependent aminotransferase [Nitrososphaerales archaeon]|nr:pyridoxal phosphate-dependent aminotransferase [Nitrososphaerales archaeon]